MSYEIKFKSLDRNRKFQFLYYCVKENQTAVLRWLNQSLVIDGASENEYKETICDALDYLKKLLFPKIDDAVIKDKEIMLNGIADDLVMLVEEISETTNSSSKMRALASISALEWAYTVLVDCIFGSEDYNLDNNAFRVILLATIGYDLERDYEGFANDAGLSLDWDSLKELQREHPGIQYEVENFMNYIFTKTALA